MVIGRVLMEIGSFYCVGAARSGSYQLNSKHRKIQTIKINSPIRPLLLIRGNNGNGWWWACGDWAGIDGDRKIFLCGGGKKRIVSMEQLA